MMTKKQETIKAMIETAEKYENPKGNVFFNQSHCPICKLFFQLDIDAEYGECIPCPFANISGEIGCVKFESFKNAHKNHWATVYGKISPTFLTRAATLRKHAAICEMWREERFTDGWIYSGKELSRDD